ncbi:hypothetical protein C6A85_11345, partial [Mycobacterium sp. ITM-2017-0098]
LTDAHLGQRPEPATRKSDIILLTSGTTGSPKGAKRSAGSGGAVTVDQPERRLGVELASGHDGAGQQRGEEQLREAPGMEHR